ncbi:hypothetical protein BCR33DRAFT_579907 [Rhizoclosmatium globosum]|uniref:Uncharacterized protein n=1 Tax=Rhizoclosmatium globosum TaxID=329046 RepID=A0A1Y2CQL3_9FUNG|nr:hypothetical protein BCR33DRAFT_579907 [Rhizoclosmatium globosum]|eukprot:ORY49322.1 hypothetical protein BCR33DRAFT_579907 [Rhizoclosmatium globosum]
MDPTLSKVISDLQQVSEKLFQAQQKSNDFVCQADMSYLETSLKFISKEVSQLQTIISQAASTDNPSRTLIQSLVDKVNQIESNLEHNTYGNNFLNDLRLENAKLRKKIDLVKVDHEEIEKNLSNAKTEIRDLQEQLKNTTAAKHRIETEFQNLQTEHKVLGGELNTLQNHIRFYEDERQIFKETAYYLQEQLHHSEKSHQTKDKRIHALEYSLNEQLEKYAESESKLGVQRKLNDRLMNNYQWFNQFKLHPNRNLNSRQRFQHHLKKLIPLMELKNYNNKLLKWKLNWQN